MRQLDVFFLTSLVSVCLLGSCDKPEETQDPSQAAATAPARGSVQGGSSIDPPPPAPATAGSTASAKAPDGTKSKAVSQVDLSGRWIALFGRTAGGSTIDDAWKSGETLEFKNSGGIIWTQKTGATPIELQTSIDGLSLTITPPAGTQNVGRDDEVGLLNVGRDDEVGLLKDDKGQQTGTSGSGPLKKTLFRDGSFLAIMGRQNDIMVYGKVEGAESSQPDIKGNYTATVVSTTGLPARFEWKENYLEATFENGAGAFKGMWVNGYFVGVTNGMAGSGLAAITRQADGSLNGILLPSPFTTMNANFDFAPGQ